MSFIRYSVNSRLYAIHFYYSVKVIIYNYVVQNDILCYVSICIALPFLYYTYLYQEDLYQKDKNTLEENSIKNKIHILINE